MNALVKCAFLLLLVSFCHESACDETQCVKDFFSCVLKNSSYKAILDGIETVCCVRKYNDSKRIFFDAFNECFIHKIFTVYAKCLHKISTKCTEVMNAYFERISTRYGDFYWDVRRKMGGLSAHPERPDDCNEYLGSYNLAIVAQCKENNDPVLKTLCDMILQINAEGFSF